MLQEIPLDSIAGKTVLRCGVSCWRNQLFLVFSDRTFTTIGLNYDYDGNCEIVGDSLQYPTESAKELVDLGIYSACEMEELIIHEKRTIETSCEARERQKYEELKRKFGDEGACK